MRTSKFFVVTISLFFSVACVSLILVSKQGHAGAGECMYVLDLNLYSSVPQQILDLVRDPILKNMKPGSALKICPGMTEDGSINLYDYVEYLEPPIIIQNRICYFRSKFIYKNDAGKFSFYQKNSYSPYSGHMSEIYDNCPSVLSERYALTVNITPGMYLYIKSWIRRVLEENLDRKFFAEFNDKRVDRAIINKDLIDNIRNYIIKNNRKIVYNIIQIDSGGYYDDNILYINIKFSGMKKVFSFGIDFFDQGMMIISLSELEY